MKALLPFLLTLFAALPLSAQEQPAAPPVAKPAAEAPTPTAQPAEDTEALMTDEAICKKDADSVSRLRDELRSYRSTSNEIEAVIKGRAPATLTAVALERLLSGNQGETAPLAWPEQLHCERLQESYARLRANLIWQKELLANLRRADWGELPPELRELLLNLWTSRTRLAHSNEVLHQRLSDAKFTGLLQALEAQGAQLQSQRLAFLNLLPSLGRQVDPGLVTQWLELWKGSLDLVDSLQPLPPSQLQELDGDTRHVVAFHYNLTRLDASFQAGKLNRIRSYLWKNHPDAFERALELEASRSQLLLTELRAARNVFYLLYLDVIAGGPGPGESTHVTIWRIFQGFEYFIGLLGFVALAVLARRSKAPTGNLQARLARTYRRARGHALVSRLTANIPELLPWAIGWFGLILLDRLFRKYGVELLIALIPFARLYIAYGLLCLAGEWFEYRVAGQAGCFLNTQQQTLAARKARHFAAIIVLPWLLQDFVGLTLGPSLSLELSGLLTIAAIIVALDLLLLPWRREFIQALQSFLPQAGDNIVERCFGGLGFLLLAPLATVPLLLAILAYSLHKNVVEFDWYRKLIARSFKLRSGSGEEEEAAAEPEHPALQDYQRWFGGIVEGEKLPVIKVSSMQPLCELIQAWLSRRSDDNSLLLSGERGAGKSTLVREMQAWLSQQPGGPRMHCITVPPKTITPAAVAALLQPALEVDLSSGPGELVRSDEERPPTVVILEDAQNFFLREVGGLAGWEFLLTLTRARLKNVFWLAVMNNHSWAYLANVFNADYQFTQVMRTRPWTQNEIRSLILSRNQMSGYQIRYDSILLSTRGPEAGNIRNAEQLYFSLLWDDCRGNPLQALGLWLASVTVSGTTVTVGLPPELSSSASESLDSELYFVYAALVIHENMTSAELVSATAMPEGQVRAALRTGFNMGFINRSPDRRYRVMPMWSRTLTRILASKNLLHE